MNNIANNLKYVAVDMPVDFVRFVGRQFCASELAATKNLEDRVNLVSSSIKLFHEFCSSNPGLCKISDSCKDFKSSVTIFTFIPKTADGIKDLFTKGYQGLYKTIVNICSLLKNFFKGLDESGRILGACKFVAQSKMITLPFKAVSDVFGFVHASFTLGETLKKTFSKINLRRSCEIRSEVSSRVFNLANKVSIAALAIISIVGISSSLGYTLPTCVVLSTAATSYWGFASALTGFLNKYAEYCLDWHQNNAPPAQGEIENNEAPGAENRGAPAAAVELVRAQVQEEAQVGNGGIIVPAAVAQDHIEAGNVA